MNNDLEIAKNKLAEFMAAVEKDPENETLARVVVILSNEITRLMAEEKR
ncbi:hypothetical protein [Kitasatospora acidiphila]|nr:hypothetical protein [Kitasatospora acidiphila]